MGSREGLKPSQSREEGERGYHRPGSWANLPAALIRRGFRSPAQRVVVMKTDLITSLALLWGATGLFVADVRVVLAADGDRDSDFPQVLTPSRLPQRLDEAPSTVTIIDRAMIEASGARRLVDVLRLVPGLQVGYKNNSLPTATYHGLSDEYARRLLLLLNGQRIFQYSRGVIEWNNLPIPLENIERIEVVRGPAGTRSDLPLPRRRRGRGSPEGPLRPQGLSHPPSGPRRPVGL